MWILTKHYICHVTYHTSRYYIHQASILRPHFNHTHLVIYLTYSYTGYYTAIWITSLSLWHVDKFPFVLPFESYLIINCSILFIASTNWCTRCFLFSCTKHIYICNIFSGKIFTFLADHLPVLLHPQAVAGSIYIMIPRGWQINHLLVR